MVLAVLPNNGGRLFGVKGLWKVQSLYPSREGRARAQGHQLPIKSLSRRYDTFLNCIH